MTKKFNINRRIRDGPTGGYVQVTKTIECPIKPGYKAGTKLTFPDDGDEQPDGNATHLRLCYVLARNDFNAELVFASIIESLAHPSSIHSSKQRPIAF